VKNEDLTPRFFFDIAEEMPNEVQLTANTCPARLNDPEDICAGNVREYRRRLMTYLNRSLSEGIATGEFTPVPLEETAILILSVINGIVRYRKMQRDPKKKLCKASVDFCRRSLMNISRGGGNKKIKT
jgi:hypothetical protein